MTRFNATLSDALLRLSKHAHMSCDHRLMTQTKCERRASNRKSQAKYVKKNKAKHAAAVKKSAAKKSTKKTSNATKSAAAKGKGKNPKGKMGAPRKC